MPEQFELFKEEEKNSDEEETKDVKKEEAEDVKKVRKPGSKYYDPKFGSYKEQDEYVQKVLGGESANIQKRIEKKAEEARRALEKRGIIDKKEES